MTIRALPTNTPPIVALDFLRRASASDYLEALNTHAPGLDLRWDDAVALGLDVARAIREGNWEPWRKAALPYLDDDELDVLALAAVAHLAPGPTPEPFASWLALATLARERRHTPDDVVDLFGTHFAAAADQHVEDA